MAKDDLTSMREKLLHLAPNLSPDAASILADMYTAERLRGTASPDPIAFNRDVKISPEQGASMHTLMRANNISRSLEIGFAYGYSTLWMIDAVRAQPGGSHIAIDPFQDELWHNIGLAQAARLGTPEGFQLIKDFAVHALPALIKERKTQQFIHIDGNHRFDDVLVDFYLSDLLLDVGGLIALDDMWMPSVQGVADFIRTNRDYDVVEQPVRNMMVFRKRGWDYREWNHYVPFTLSQAKP